MTNMKDKTEVKGANLTQPLTHDTAFDLKLKISLKTCFKNQIEKSITYFKASVM